MLTLDRQAASVAPEETEASAPERQAERSRASLTNRDRQMIATLIQPVAKIVQIDEPAVDPAVRRSMPVVVPMLAVLISGCILAIWSIL
jgi:hypothetical protein